jgi:hypothetical protein
MQRLAIRVTLPLSPALSTHEIASSPLFHQGLTGALDLIYFAAFQHPSTKAVFKSSEVLDSRESSWDSHIVQWLPNDSSPGLANGFTSAGR